MRPLMNGGARRVPGGGRVALRARRALITITTGLGLVLIAFVFAAAPLLVCGLAFVGVGALAPLWVVLSVRGTRARRTLVAERVVEGESLHAIVEVRRPLSAWGWGRLEIIDPLASAPLRLGGEGSPVRRVRAARIELVTTLSPRGERRLEAPRIIARDPLGLAVAHAHVAVPAQTVLVLPRVSAVRWLGVNSARRFNGEDGERRSDAAAAAELQGLRPYRPGTPASRIHWPALARGRGLLERRLEADGDDRPLIVLDARVRGSGVRRERDGLDAAVRAVASLVLELARSGGCGLLLPGQSQPVTITAALAGWPAVHARLATVGTDVDRDRDRAPALTSPSQRRGPLLYVAAVSHERLAATLVRAGRGTTVFVVPESELIAERPRGLSGAANPVLAVSGCRGFALGAPREERLREATAGARGGR